MPQYQNDINETPFGMTETVRFFETNMETPETRHHIDENQPDLLVDLSTAYDEYVNREKTQKPVLVQRDKTLFWDIIFRQQFDIARHDIRVRFAGEAAADEGGPLCEFLTLCMKNFSKASLFIGSNSCLGFKNDVESNLKKKYFKIGQLVGLAIILMGRGPECIHPAIVRELFSEEQPTDSIEPIDDYQICQNIESIHRDNFDCLYDIDISPMGKTKEELVRLYCGGSVKSRRT